MALDLDYQYYYLKWHRDTPEHWRSVTDYYRALFGPHLRGAARGAALDIGCGMGFAMEFLRQEGFSPVRGVDADKQQVESCRSRGLDAVLSDTIDALLDRPYALITAIDLVEHLPKEEALGMLRKACAALEPGGLFLCRVPNANSALAERWRYNDYTHLESYTEHSLDFLLHNAGFGSVTVLAGELPRRMPFPLRVRSFLSWANFAATRAFRRMQCVAELGDEGWECPLSLNLLGIAIK